MERLVLAVVAQQACTPGQLGRARPYHPTLAGRDQFVAVERKCRDVSKGAGQCILPARSKRLRTIFNEQELVVAAKLRKLRHVRRCAIKMSNHNGPRAVVYSVAN